MNARIFCLAGLGCLLLSGLVSAQQSFSRDSFGQPIASQQAEPADTPFRPDPKRMNEDIEIMRRILERSLVTAPATVTTGESVLGYYPPSKALITTSGKGGNSARLWDVQTGQLLRDVQDNVYKVHGLDVHGPEGTYLPGYGVVYSLTLPLHFQDVLPRETPAGTQRKTLTQWDRVRGELHGDKVPAEEKPRGRKNPSIAETVTRVLADNGQHFNLMRDQRVSVAITLRTTACVSCHSVALSREARLTYPIEDLLVPQPARDNSGGSAVGSATIEQLTRDGIPNDPKEKAAAIERRQTQAGNFAQLGDMRLKEGRPQEAMEAYRKAVALWQMILEAQPRTWKHSYGSSPIPPDSALAMTITYLTRLAQTQVLVGESDQAQQTFKAAANLARGVAAAAGAKGADRSAGELPGKLTISASKQLLDQVGSGKITFEEFKKHVTVDYWTPEANNATDKGN